MPVDDLVELYFSARSGAIVDKSLIERETHADDPLRRAGAMSLKAWLSQDDKEAAVALAEEALEIFARSDGDCAELEFTALNVLGIMVDGKGLRDEAVTYFERALNVALKHDFALGIGLASSNLCWRSLMRGGNLGESLRNIWDMMSHPLGDPVLRCIAGHTYGLILRHFGISDSAAIKFLTAALEADRAQDYAMKSRSRFDLTMALLADGRLSEAERVVQELQHIETPSVRFFEVDRQLVEIEMMIARGDYDLAAAALELVPNSYSALCQIDGLSQEVVSARLQEALGDPEAALRTFRSAPYLGATTFDGSILDEFELRLLKSTRRWDEALPVARRILERTEGWCRKLDELPKFETTSATSVLLNTSATRHRMHVRERLRAAAGRQAAAIAHEVRNALAPLTLAVSMQQVSGSSAEFRERFINAVARSERQIQFIADRFDVRTPQAAVIEGLDLGTLVNNIGESFGDVGKSKSIRVTVKTQPAPVHSDLGIVSMVLSNIIGNAVKYSNIGSTVGVTLNRKETNRQVEYQVEIVDGGPGFSGDDLANAFQPNGVLSAIPTGGETSTGLGLYISKTMLALVGGEISLGNRHDQVGARVTVRIPQVPGVGDSAAFSLDDRSLETDMLTPEPVIHLSPEPSSAADARVCLIVDDNPLIIDYLQLALSQLGWHAYAATTLREAELILDGGVRINLAIVDLNLRDSQHGSELVERIRKDLPSLDVVVTSSVPIAEAARYPSLFGLPFLQKPYTEESLRRVLAHISGQGESGLRRIVADLADDDSIMVPVRYRELAGNAAASRANRPDEAESEYRRALDFARLYEFGPGIVDASWALAEIAAETGRFADQVEALTDLANHPSMPSTTRADAYESLAWAYLDRHAVERSREMFKLAAHYRTGLAEQAGDLVPMGDTVIPGDTTLPFGLGVCDVIAGDSATLPGLTGVQSDSRFADTAQFWHKELTRGRKDVVDLSSSEPERIEALSFGDLASLERVAVAAGELQVACQAVEKLISLRREHVRDLFGVFDIACERVAQQTRIDLEGELEILNDELFHVLAEQENNTALFLLGISDELASASSMPDGISKERFIEALDELTTGFDQHRQVQAARSERILVSHAIAFLVHGTQRQATDKRIALIWEPPEADALVNISDIDDLQADLINRISTSPLGATLEAAILTDPTRLVVNSLHPLEAQPA